MCLRAKLLPVTCQLVAVVVVVVAAVVVVIVLGKEIEVVVEFG